MDRNGILLAGLQPATARIIEIGPSFSPVAPKRHGWRTTVVDHTDRAGLVAKYGVHHGLDIGAIEDVDHVWAGGLLHGVIPTADHRTYHALIASHVIEHLVDPISFLDSADRLLAPGGRVLLAVPDLRLCFDCLRPVSTTGQIIAAWREKRQRHSWAAVFDAHAYDARPDGQRPSWPRGFAFEPKLVGELHEIGRTLEGYRDSGEGAYLDVHGWTFTPASFALLMLETRALGLSRWRVTELVECESVEFLVVLERDERPPLVGEALARERIALLLRRCAELRDLADWLLGDRAAVPAYPPIRPVSDQDSPLRPMSSTEPSSNAEPTLAHVTQALLRMTETLQSVRRGGK
jgi:SAM-dependent methyltransferase